jgi:hypothetical protein
MGYINNVNYVIQTDSCIAFVNGLKEFNNGNIKIYPNPTTSILNLIDEQNQLQNAIIEIKNSLGQTCHKAPFSNQIDLSNLSAGMYFLTIQDVKNKKTIKIIKEE